MLVCHLSVKAQVGWQTLLWNNESIKRHYYDIKNNVMKCRHRNHQSLPSCTIRNHNIISNTELVIAHLMVRASWETSCSECTYSVDSGRHSVHFVLVWQVTDVHGGQISHVIYDLLPSQCGQSVAQSVQPFANVRVHMHINATHFPQHIQCPGPGTTALCGNTEVTFLGSLECSYLNISGIKWMMAYGTPMSVRTRPMAPSPQLSSVHMSPRCSTCSWGLWIPPHFSPFTCYSKNRHGPPSLASIN